MGGECIAIKTYGKRIDKMVIKNPVASKIAFGENPKILLWKRRKNATNKDGNCSAFKRTIKES